MKIDNSVKQLPGIAPVGEGQARQTTAASGTAAPARESDSVELSPLSAKLKDIEQRLASAEVVDAAKIAEVKAAIAEGRFKINPEVIAEKLIDAARELLSGRRI